MYPVRLNTVSFALLMSLFFGLSNLLLTYYTLGDQVHYWRFYEALSSANTADVMPLARGHVSSAEPISAYLLWLGASFGIQKNTFISLLNVILLLGILLLMRKHKAPWYVQILIFTNFYVIVLMTGAERLKIAYILLVYAALVPGKLGLALALASPLAHLQSFILLGGLAASKASGNIRSIVGRMRMRKRALISVLVLAPIVGLVFILLQEGIMIKATGYMARAGAISEVFQILLLAGVAFFVAKDRVRMGLMLITMMVAIFLLGGIRVNMIAISLFVYLVMLEGRLQHPLVLALLGYFSLKSVFFIKNIFTYGDGFGGWLL